MVASLKLSERVTFAGVTPHLEAYYNLADIFVMLPDQEANSIACHEAMSCGLPVVAANRGGFVETVPPEAGILVDPRCPAEVDAALARLVAQPDLRQAMGRAGRVNILAHHSWERVAQQFLEALA
jgi:glycosyltransferase involved in cell wall biosynthesis